VAGSGLKKSQVLEAWQVLSINVFPSKFCADRFVFYNILL
jgi:hypothetical protein